MHANYRCRLHLRATTTTQAAVREFFQLKPGASIEDVGRALKISRSGANSTLSKLARRGTVMRLPTRPVTFVLTVRVQEKPKESTERR